MLRLRRVQPPREKTDPRYLKLWAIVDAAILDTFSRHPDYLTEHGRQKAQQSIAKRVVGALFGLIQQTQNRI